jgi:hypothetical protein
MQPYSGPEQLPKFCSIKLFNLEAAFSSAPTAKALAGNGRNGQRIRVMLAVQVIQLQ